MKLEIGKKYVTLEGIILTAIGIGDSEVYPIICVDSLGQRYTYTIKGIFDINSRKPYPRDIVSEYVEEKSKTLYERVMEAYNKHQDEEFKRHFDSLSKELLLFSSNGKRDYKYNTQDMDVSIREKIFKELTTQGFKVVFTDLYTLKINWS